MAAQQVIERLKRKDWGVVEETGQVIPGVGEEVVPLLDSDDAEVRELAVYYLNKSGGAPARTGLFKALRDEDDMVRAAASRFLHRHYAKEDMQRVLAEATGNPDEYVREQMALLAGKMGDLSAIAPLKAHVGEERDTNARHGMSLALARLGEEESRQAVVTRLEDESPHDRATALKDLIYVHDHSLLKHVQPLLDDKRPAINVGPSHGPYMIRVCDVAVNVLDELLDHPFSFDVQHAVRYKDESLREAKKLLASRGFTPRSKE